jgi:Nif-specific regulatory protein
MRNKKDRESQAGHEAKTSARDIFAEVESDIEEVKRSETVRTEENLRGRFEKAQHKLDKLELLTDISQSLNSTLNLNELLEKIIDSVIRLTDTDRGFLMLMNGGGALEFTIARDREKRSLEEGDFTISMTIANDVARSGKPLFLSDALEDARFKDQKSVLNLQLRTAVCVPLTVEDKVLGVIYADSGRLSPSLSPDDMSIVSAFASQAAIAIENAKLHGELVLSQENLARENLRLKQELSGKYEFSGIIGRSRAMQEIFLTIQKVAPLSTTVLVQGETGTGKELIARAIHFNGPRKAKQLVTINCGAMPPELLESELFGHKKGAFTGATSDKAGLFITANGGTIFLDEIGEMPLALQVKLLRVLQDGEVRPVGENTPRKVDVRVIAATNRDLADDVKAGVFRRDLYYRLNVVPINLPPLRQRREDILPLIEHFLRKFELKMQKQGLEIAPDALKLLLTNAWPGNVRELENAIERAVALCGESRVLTAQHFPNIVPEPAPYEDFEQSKSLKQKLQAVEKQIIIDTLEKTGYKVTKAAEILEVTRQHLHNKIRKHKIRLS